MAIVVTIEQIKEQAKWLKDYLSEKRAVYDCVGLGFEGYDECDTKVVIDGKERTVGQIVCDDFNGDYNKLKEANIEIQAVSVVERDACDMLRFGVFSGTYDRRTGAFTFSVADDNYSHSESILENVTLDNVEEKFAKAKEEIERKSVN